MRAEPSAGCVLSPFPSARVSPIERDQKGTGDYPKAEQDVPQSDALGGLNTEYPAIFG
jgi:hypothetical protein